MTETKEDARAFAKFAERSLRPVEVINCITCAHLVGDTSSATDRCLKTGFSISVSRQYRQSVCDSDFSGWTARPSNPKPWFIRIFTK